MDAPAITRSRRPFLAPIWVTALLLLAAVGLVIAVYESATITTVLVAGVGEAAPGSIADPPLSPEGEVRARRLGDLLASTGASGPGRIEAIYIMDTRAIRQLATSLAGRLALQPVTLTEQSMDAAAARALAEHRGGTVLIIARNSSVPALIRALSGAGIGSQPETESSLFVVPVPTFGHASLLRLSY